MLSEDFQDPPPKSFEHERLPPAVLARCYMYPLQACRLAGQHAQLGPLKVPPKCSEEKRDSARLVGDFLTPHWITRKMPQLLQWKRKEVDETLHGPYASHAYIHR